MRQFWYGKFKLMTLFDEQTQREEYNESLRKKSIEEGIEIGEKKGIEIGEKKGKIATLADLVKKGWLFAVCSG